MKIVIYVVAFIGLAQCAKLDHLKYLPPDNRPANKESFDQGLAAPTTSQDTGAFGGEQQQTGSFGQSKSFEPQPTAPGSFNAGSQNAARLQGAPFIPQSTSGTFSSFAPASQQNQGFSKGQQELNKPQSANEPSTVSGTFRSTQQGQQSEGEPTSQPQGFFGSETQKPGSQYTSQFQGPSSAFGNIAKSSQVGIETQRNQPHKMYGVPDSQASVSEGAQSARGYGANQGQSGSGQTFSGTTGPRAGVSQSSPFAPSSPVINNYQSQTSPGTFAAGSQYPGNVDSTSTGKNVSPTRSYSSQQPTQSFGDQHQSAPSSGSFGKPSGNFEAGYSKTSQVPGSFGPGKSSGSFNDQSQTSPGTFAAGSQYPGNIESTSTGKNVSPTGSYSSQQPTQSFGDQHQSAPSSGSFGTLPGTFEAGYSKTGQAPGSFGPGKSSGSFNDQSSQYKYQPSSQNQIPIIRLDTKNYGDGTYSTAYETGNGIKAEEQGHTEGDNSIAQGSFSYTSPEGEKVGLTYTADEDGYHPQGEHLPTPPPIPEAILKSIEYNNAHPEEENDDGSYNEPSSPESSQQYKSSFGKTQYPGSSNKYLAPSSGERNQFSGSPSTSLVRGTPTSGSSSFQAQEPSSSRATFSPSSYPSSSASNEPQDDDSISVSSPDTSNYGGQPSYPTGNRQVSASPDYQYKASSFGGSPNGPSTGSNGAFPSSSKSSVPQIGQFPTQPSISGSANTPSAPSGTSFGPSYHRDSQKIVSGQQSYQNSDSGSVKGPSSSSGAGTTHFGPGSVSNENKLVSGQYSGFTGPQGQQNTQSSYSSGPSASKSSQLSGYQYNAPIKTFGSSGSSNFQKQGVSEPKTSPSTNTQYGAPNAPFGSSDSSNFQQPSFSQSKASPSANSQYGAPNTPFGSSGSSNFQQPNVLQPKASPSGNAQYGAPNTPFGSSGSINFQQPGLSQPKASPSSNTEYGAPNTPFGSSGSSNFQQPNVLQPKASLSGNTQYGAPKTPFGSSGSSNFQQQGLAQPNASPSTNTQYGAPTTPFGTSGSANFQKPDPSQARAFPSSEAATNSKFSSGSGPSKIVGEFGSGEFRGHSGPTGTPGVQAQDENGGYLY